MKKLEVIFSLLFISSCSIFNPNPGENEADTLIQKKQYDNAIAIIEPYANQGVPWAQLRLGIAYEYGQGKTASGTEALQWYKQVATHTVDLPWGDGVQVISSGPDGFFNQNNDAKVAQYLIARLYFQGGRGVAKDNIEAWRWANYTKNNSEGKDIVFCCENSKLKTQYITQERITALLSDIEKMLPIAELNALKESQENWKPY